MSGVLFVSGASSDVGVALVTSVAPQYERIICHHSRPESAERFAPLIERLPEKFIPMLADFADERSLQALVERMEREEWRPLHFVHLAASSESINKRFRKTPWHLFERELHICLRSAVTLSEAFLPHMVRERHGKIVFVLSSATLWEPAKAYSSSYTTVKYALLGLMKSLAAEYAADGITVNAVSPAMIDTKFIKMPDIIRQANIDAAPRKRLLTVDDVIPMIDFLLSCGADSITGQNFGVTGGC